VLRAAREQTQKIVRVLSPEPIRVEAALGGITTPGWRYSNSLIAGLIPSPAAVASLVPRAGTAQADRREVQDDRARRTAPALPV
jgi:hypothetical protein